MIVSIDTKTSLLQAFPILLRAARDPGAEESNSQLSVGSGYRGRRRLFLRIFGPLGPTVGARAPLQLAGTLLFDKVNSAKGFSLLTGGERRCVKWFKNVFTVELTELLQ